jgi:hypothetical protein
MHSVRRYLETGEPIEVFRADIDGVRTAMLSKCVRVRRTSRKFVIVLDELCEFIEKVSRGMLSVHMSTAEREYRLVELNASYVLETVGQEIVPFLNGLIAKHKSSAAVFPIKVLGDIAKRLA